MGEEQVPARCRCSPKYGKPLLDLWYGPRQVEGWPITAWCGMCDERTRLSDTAAGAVARCRCHPLYGQPLDTDVRPVPTLVVDGDEAPKPARPNWCGTCDQATRQRQDESGRMARCCCHPLHGKVTDPDVRPVPVRETDGDGDEIPNPNRPNWCGTCDQATRLLATTAGHMMRCRCHPLHTEPTAEPRPERVTGASARRVAATATGIRATLRDVRGSGWTRPPNADT